VALVVGTVIGSGIFFKPPQIAAELGSFPIIVSVWLAGGVLCLLGALCVSELAAMLPRAGGLYVYLREAYGSLPAFLFGWTEFWVMRPASVGALATAFTLPLDWSGTTRLTVSLGVVLLLAWINIMGVIWGGKTQDLTTLIKVGFLAGIAVLPFLVGGAAISNFGSVGATASDKSLLSRIAVALLAVLWAYNGWHQVTPVAEEIKNPQRNLPWALTIGVIALIALYVGANVAYHGVFSITQVAQAKNVAVGVMDKIIGPVGGTIMTALIMCSIFGAINSDMLYGPRVFFAMGRDRVFFPQLGRVHVTRHTPSYAIATQTLLAVAMMLAAGFIPTGELAEAVPLGPDQIQPIPERYAAHFQYRQKKGAGAAVSQEDETTEWELVYRGTPMPLAEREAVAALSTETKYRDAVKALYNRSNVHVFDVLTDLVIFGGSIFYVLTVGAVIVLRIRRPQWERPYRTWGYPWAPLVFLAVYAWFLPMIFLEKRLESIVGLVIIATGVPAYFIWSRGWGAGTSDDFENASS
jgi:APA family basic amino acid/polyamine antiporter